MDVWKDVAAELLDVWSASEGSVISTGLHSLNREVLLYLGKKKGLQIKRQKSCDSREMVLI